MTQALDGKRIAIAGSRKTEEMSTLIERRGGVPLIRPLQGTVFLAEQELEADLRFLAEQGADWVVFTTGAGLETIFEHAGKLGIATALMDAVSQAKVASRGYKTFAALKKLGITPEAVDNNGTTQGLIHALESHDWYGQRAVVQLHGEPAPALVQFLEGKGAAVCQITPYRHIPPDAETVEQLCREITDGCIDAVCFTTALQVRNLFRYAAQIDRGEQIRQAFQRGVLAAAVGKVTAEALKEQGVERYLMPESERMGAMIVELANYYV